MKEQKIEITINEDGSIFVDADGFTGDSCVKEIETLLGDLSTTKEINKKPEYYNRATTTSHQYLSGGRQG